MLMMSIVAMMALTLAQVSREVTLAERIASTVTAEVLKRERLESDRLREEVQRSLSESQQREHCVPGLEPSTCVVVQNPHKITDLGDRFLPPFPPAVRPYLSAGIKPGQLLSIDYSWAPLRSVSQGPATLKRLLDRSAAYHPEGCLDEECDVVVSSSAHDEAGRTLAVCRAVVIRDSAGPPVNCQPVAVQLGQEWWMRVIDRRAFVMATRIPVYKLDVVGLSRDSIIIALDHDAAGSPLSLEARSIKEDRLLALGSRRLSTVLAGNLFEWAQIVIELDGEYQVRISLDLLVSKQNTANPADWYVPTDQQIDEYRRAIKTTVARSLDASCLEPTWTGNDKLRCNQLRTSDGSTVHIPEGASIRPEDGLDPRIKVRR